MLASQIHVRMRNGGASSPDTSATVWTAPPSPDVIPHIFRHTCASRLVQKRIYIYNRISRAGCAHTGRELIPAGSRQDEHPLIFDPASRRPLAWCAAYKAYYRPLISSSRGTTCQAPVSQNLDPRMHAKRI
jgi:hypothetical protein